MTNATANPKVELLETVRAWPLEERIEFASQVWDELVNDGWEPTLTPELKTLLDQRIASYEADPTNVYTWDEVLAYVTRPR